MPNSETDSKLCPQLRLVEAFPVQVDNQDMICLRDPLGIAEQPIFLNQILVFLISHMDGKHTLQDIQADFYLTFSETLPIEMLEKLVAQLDQQHYLDSPGFHQYYEKLIEEFQNLPTRPSRHAGVAYEGTGEALTKQLKGYFELPQGPGDTSSVNDGSPLRGLIAPHIDFTRGGPVYAHAYKALKDHPGAGVFIIFGTCHAGMPQRFSISSKDYETPIGPVLADKEFIARLANKLGNEYRQEFSHRGEHSIEFQAVWLKHVFHSTDFRIVPILVNSFHDICSEGRTAGEDPEILEVASAIRETIRESSARVCIIASADLAHVGRQFGDLASPSPAFLEKVEEADLSFLELVERGDAEGMFQSIAADNDQRRVCGYAPIYMTLRCMENPKGKLLKYQQWTGPDDAVTYAALAFY
jgi:AmmeMemoRadiSam system protein B